MVCLQLGLAFPVYLTNDQSQSVPGLLIPSLLPDRDVEVEHVCIQPRQYLMLTLLQATERELMTEGMPRTELVLALYMSEQLTKGRENHLSQRHVTDRCILPMGFMEQASCTHSSAPL